MESPVCVGAVMKSNYSIINGLLLWTIILWFSLLNKFFPQYIVNIVDITLMGIGGLFFIGKIYYQGISKFDVAVILLVFIHPVIAGIQASRIFGQPFFVGFASLRGGLLLLFSYYLYARHFTAQEFLSKIHRYNAFIVILSFVLLYVLQIDDSVLAMLRFERTDIVLTGTLETNELRGARLTFGTSFLLLSYICCIVNYERKHCRKYILYGIVIIAYLLFVHKGRTALVGFVLLLIMNILSHLTIKRLMWILWIFLLVCIAIFAIPVIRDRFLVLFDIFLGGTNAEQSGDFSGISRLNNIILAWPLICEHAWLGVGNLSYMFNNGFIGYFQSHFYIADIGIIGTLLVGGIVSLIMYILYYYYMVKAAARQSEYVKAIVRLVVCYYILLLFMGSDVLFNDPINVAFVTFLAITRTDRKNDK